MTGSYEDKAVGYKHVYFNVNYNTLVLWWSTVLGMILLYEAVRYQLRLSVERRLRLSASVLLTASVYPHYYTWWLYFNIFNDDFFDQFYHQVLSSSHLSLFQRQIDRQTHSQTDRHTQRQTYTHRETDWQPDRQTYTETDIHTQRDRLTDRQTDRHTQKQTDRQTHTQRDRLTDRQTDTETDRHTDCRRRRRNCYDKKPQRYAKDNRTAYLTARSDKSVAYVTNNNRLYSTFCTVEANYWQTRSIARPLCDSRATCFGTRCDNMHVTLAVNVSVQGGIKCTHCESCETRHC